MIEKEEESTSTKTVKYVKTLERAEAKKGSEETQEVVELAQVEVNEEDVEWRTEGEAQYEEEGGDLDPEQVRQGREDKMNHMVETLGMLELVAKSNVESRQARRSQCGQHRGPEERTVQRPDRRESDSIWAGNDHNHTQRC